MHFLLITLSACQNAALDQDTRAQEAAPIVDRTLVLYPQLSVLLGSKETHLQLANANITLETGATGAFQAGSCQGELACEGPVQRPTATGWEWWQKSPQGLEQGWIVNQGGDSVSQEVLVHGATPQDLGANQALLVSASGVKVRVHHLAAWDAQGRELPVEMSVQGQSLWIETDTRGAVWPVTIDPSYSTVTEEILGGYTSDMDFGGRVMSAGDLNGDGYDELLVGADTYGSHGFYWVFNGSATGPSADEDLLIDGGGATETHKARIAAGDVNGDGYGDLVFRERNQNKSGDLLTVHLGSALGISTTADAAIPWTSAFDTTAHPMVLCDVNGDGYDDAVTMGASYSISVFSGSSSGLSGSYSSSTTSLHYTEASMSCAGDVDGDSYEDLVLGNYQSEGAELFFGSASGLASSAGWTQSSSSGVPKYGSQVLGLGDVNGDGYDDVAVGHKAYGYVELFLGSSSGPGTSPDQTYVGSVIGHPQVIAAPGDLDGDGIDDLALLEPKYGSYGSTELGHVTVHLGASGGPSTTADATYSGDPSVGIEVLAAAGDTDGDGYADLGVGMEEEFAGVLTGAASPSLSLDHSWEPEDWHPRIGYTLASDDWDADGYDDLAYGYDDAETAVNWGGSAGLSSSADETFEMYAGYLLAPGDVDGDGYPELLVLSSSGGSEGRLYYGSSSGLSTSYDDLPVSPPHNDSRTAASGDLNGDGYADLAFNSGAGLGAGSTQVPVHLGSISGIDTTAAWTANSSKSSQHVGEALVIADFDGDGYDDLLLTASSADTVLVAGINLYFGSATGLASTPDQTLSITTMAVDRAAGVGDVDGDGYPDVLVGTATASELYLGGSTGLTATGSGPTPIWSERYGDFYYAGDVNEDGYNDVLIAAKYSAMVYLYLGNSTGLDTSWDRSFDTGQLNRVGGVATDVDWDGNGYSDLAVAVVPKSSVRGRITLFLGELDSDGDGTVDSEDCAPSDASLILYTYYLDSDGDGYGDSSSESEGCSAPSGYVSDDTDCDDTDATVNPGATEVCDSADTDEDCSGAADDNDAGATGQSTWYADADGDTYGDSSSTLDLCDVTSGYVADNTDCDDTSAAVNPATIEICDALNVDENCDGLADDEDPYANGRSNVYFDSDGDGYGDASNALGKCDESTGWVRDGTDCNDGDASVHPGTPEVCDAADVDENCNGLADDLDSAATGTSAWYPDSDGDSYGDPAGETWTCEDHGLIATSGDCDDTRADVNPGLVELCDADAIDEDCDGLANDESAVDHSTWHVDSDGDGYGSPDLAALACSAPSGHVADASDCDDTRLDVYPGAPEVCDGNVTDEDCDGLLGNDDAEGSVGALLFFADVDGDGFGDAGAALSLCEVQDGTVANALDCDDTQAHVNPDGIEVCDAEDLDEDCDTYADNADPEGAEGSEFFFQDQDGDGYGGEVQAALCDPSAEWMSSSQDCDDADASVHPGAAEVRKDGIDQDCDGEDQVSRSCSTTGGSPGGLWGLIALGLLGWRRRRVAS